MERRALLSNFVVTTTSDDPNQPSLRQAIQKANDNPGPDNIQFDIPASTAPQLDVPVPGFDPVTQTWTIRPLSPLPAITDQVVIDGYTQAQFPIPFRYPSAISSAVQTISVVGEPTGGTFTLTTAGAPLPAGTTAPIPYNASAATVLARLNDILGVGNIFITGGNAPVAPFNITFIGAFAGQPIPNLIPTSSLTGGVGAGVTVTTATVGGITTTDPTLITSTPNTVAAKDGNNARVRVIVDGSLTGGATGFVLAASHSSIRGLIIDGFGVGVSIPSPDNVGDLIQGNFIGPYFLFPVNATTGIAVPAPGGTIFTGFGNSLQGVLLGSTNATIGGVETQDNNVITGNGLQGVSILPGAEGNQVLGNQIGIAGPSIGGRFVIAPNGAEGVLIASSSNAVGGATAGAGNLISGNVGDGVRITGVAATRNRVEGNYIGVGPGGGFLFGAGDPGNLGNGVLIENSSDNRVGGSSAIQRNVISANEGVGVKITGPSATGNVLLNNYIGLTADGISDLGNSGEGVAIFSANNVVGAGNVISSNLRGVLISGPGATGNRVQDSFIGTDFSGQADLGNAREGVRIENATDNSIIGNARGSQVISGNNDGVAILGATSTRNIIQGNLIGTDNTGTRDLNNSLSGVLIDSAPGNTIGGTSAVARNLISANHWGVTISGVPAMNNLVQGNFIGTDITGTLPLGIEVDGVRFINSASNNQVGGLAAGAGNTIAFNINAGVNVQSGTGNSILSSNIFSNGGLGIDLGPGANHNQVPPTLTSIVSTASGTIIQGTLQSTPNTTFTIQFFANTTLDPSGSGEGERFLGSTTVTTDSTGHATITGSVPVTLPSGQFVTSTATNSSGDTSEFSAGISELLGTVQFSMASYVVGEGDGTATIVVTRVGGSGGYFTINYATGIGTATPNSDYVPVSGTLVFNPGENTKTFVIPIIDDTVAEFDETVPLILSNPTGAAKLGNPSMATLTILDNDQPGSVQFSMSNYVVNEADGTATITVVRTSGGGTVMVSFSTTDGTATAGQDYTPVSGTLTFLPGVLAQTFTIPIIDDTITEGNETVILNLANPTGGASPGMPFSAVLTITNDNRDRTGPMVQSLQLTTNRLGITGIIVTFSKDLNPARAQDLLNYGYSLQGAGLTHGFKTSRKILAGLQSAVYNAATRSVTLSLVSPIHRGAFLRLTINQVTDNPQVPVGVADLAGNLLDGNGDGRPGGVYLAFFAEGKQLSYVDNNGNKVSLQLNKGGNMDLFLRGDGGARQLRLVGVVSGQSTLTGQVRRSPSSKTGLTVLPSIVGLDGAQNRLKTPPFVIGNLSTTAALDPTPAPRGGSVRIIPRPHIQASVFATRGRS